MHEDSPLTDASSRTAGSSTEAARPDDVVTRLPRRAPGSVRRVSSLAIGPDPSWEAGVVVDAVAADLVVGAGVDARPVSERARVQLTVRLDGQSKIDRVEGDIDLRLAERLRGLPASSGFRRQLSLQEDAGLAADSLQVALLDDLPTARLISGYARLIESPPPPGTRSAPVLNVCRGWAAGSTADSLARAGRPLGLSTSPAPSIQELVEDPGDFVAELPLAPRSMRRRRILEVEPGADGLRVRQYFRDSHVDEQLVEGALHEYLMTADVGHDQVIRAIHVEPRTLPFPECPLAAPNAEVLVGTRVDELDEVVRARLTGTAGCTHLNDVLRFLRFVAPLSSIAI